MKKMHENLMAKNHLYHKWHKHSSHKLLHWLLFVLIAGGMSVALINKINTVYSANENAAAHGFQDIASRSSRKSDDHILIKFKNSASKGKRDQVLAAHGLSEKSEISQIGVKVVNIQETDTVDEVIDRLRARNKDDIEFVEADISLPPTFIPNDPYFTSQWEKQNSNTPAAWDITQGSSSIVIGVADTGVDCTHLDLSCVPGWNVYNNTADTTDLHGHGTTVAGTIAAIGNNNIGVVGQTMNSKVMPIRISDATGYASFSAIASAVTWAADHGAKIVNNSYQSGGSAAVQSAARYLKGKGGLLTVSEGNLSADAGTAASNDLIAVSGNDQGDLLYSWSSFGADVDVSAPGCVTSTTRGGGYGGVCGTSFAAPMTAGTLALIFSANPNLTPDQAQNILFSTVVDLGATGWDKYFGWGKINAGAAVALAANTIVTVDTQAPTAPANLSAPSVTSSQVNLSWVQSMDNVGVANYNIYRNGIKIGTSPVNSYSDKTVLDSTTYIYTVSATDTTGNTSLSSNGITVTTPIKIVAVAITSYQVTNKTTNSATITWTTNIPSTGSLSYGMSKTSLGLSSTDTTQSTTHTITLNSLSNFTTYYYKISAMSTDGTSQTTTIVSSFKTARK